MMQLTKRTFAKQTITWGGALSLLTVLNFPRAVWSLNPGDVMKNNEFLKRDDVSDALKSFFMTYDSTTPYPHKFNDTILKAHLRALEFYIMKGLDKEYAEHYIFTMGPLLQRIKQWVEKEGPEKGLVGMFEGTSSSYQLFERITVKAGERSFPCPYREMLENFNKYMGAFGIKWKDVCTKWCIPTWSGFAQGIGIRITVKTGEVCTIRLA